MVELLINGMHGLGDNIYSRAVVCQLLPHYAVFLRSPWPAIFHDMPTVTLVNPQTRLRTQIKNAQREGHKFRPAPSNATLTTRLWYTPTGITKYGSLPAALVGNTSETFPVCRVGGSDYRLPVPVQ